MAPPKKAAVSGSHSQQ